MSAEPCGKASRTNMTQTATLRHHYRWSCHNHSCTCDIFFEPFRPGEQPEDLEARVRAQLESGELAVPTLEQFEVCIHTLHPAAPSLLFSAARQHCLCCSILCCSIKATDLFDTLRMGRLSHAQLTQAPGLPQALVFENNHNVRAAAAISLDPARHFRPPSFEEGVARCEARLSWQGFGFGVLLRERVSSWRWNVSCSLLQVKSALAAH